MPVIQADSSKADSHGSISPVGTGNLNAWLVFRQRLRDTIHRVVKWIVRANRATFHNLFGKSRFVQAGHEFDNSAGFRPTYRRPLTALHAVEDQGELSTMIAGYVSFD